jgi:hypothetical protein
MKNKYSRVRLYGQFVTLVLLLFTLHVAAQPCVPDATNHTVGITPNNFPNGKEKVTYSQVFQMKFPSDTVVQSITVTIDSVRLDSIKGWPSGFAYECNKSDCVYNSGENGCVKVTGTPAAHGTYQVVIYYTAFGALDTMKIVSDYSDTSMFVVDDISGVSQDGSNSAFFVEGNNPNPFSYTSNVSFYLPYSGQCRLSIYNMFGRRISTRLVMGTAGKNTVQINRVGLRKGMYLYSLQYGDAIITRKMMIAD